ncbi:hypothetical protein SEVIR_7G098100v4 [Setaria viridis]|uniref:Uncharacterized protein n=2 Tax=Setaria TaxID=4554 RepID=K3YC14_SETIT|nr:protein BIC1 [Setaria italica]XP_034602403.1 protein BIC1 [Setaria viridis]RCV33534.1 hypothetical protein SETIT_7G090200v2 [Setaria italica]TKW04273.1 hypothetical protein SEVIR_7G098100v2 [Setaria viridis]
MASSGDVEAAVDAVEVEQPAKACDGETSSPATTTTEESEPVRQEQQHEDTESDADHHEAVAPPDEAAAEVSASEEPERQKPMVAEEEVEPEAAADDHQESTRERLKRHRREMAGRVWVPELWGQEKLLKDWVDCAVFDRPLVPAGLPTARRALIAECCGTRRPDRTSPASSAGSSPLRVHNGCS